VRLCCDTHKNNTETTSPDNKMAEVTEAEKQALTDFCKYHRQTEELERGRKIEQQQLAEIKKNGMDELTEMLLSSGSDIFRISQDGDDKAPSFVRIKSVSNSKALTADIVQKAVDSVNKELILELAQKLIQKKKRKTSASTSAPAQASSSDAVLEAVIRCIQEKRKNTKKVAQITDVLPKDFDAENMQEAPQEIQHYVKELVTLDERLRDIKSRYKTQLEELKMRQETVNEEVAMFLERGNKSSFKLNVSVDGDRVPYFIRKKKSTKKKQISVADLREYCTHALKKVASKIPPFEDIDSLDEQVLDDIRQVVVESLVYHIENRETVQTEKLLLQKGRHSLQNMQVFSDSDSNDSVYSDDE